ncbi:MAG: alpha/beta hydrolase [Myxococcota bacterium]
MTLLTFLACRSPAPPPPVDPPVDYGAPGPFSVGYTASAITWSGGPQVAPRTNRLAAWFPTDDTAGDSIVYDGLFPAGPEVLGGATPTDRPLPLVVFSHGHQGYAENSSFLAEHFASHGWLVLSPDHTGNTTFDGPERDTAIYWQRPLDLSATLDHAEAEYLLEGPRVVVGHSFGGYTAHATGGARYVADPCPAGPDGTSFCSDYDASDAAVFSAGLGDPRVDALVAMAPGDADLFGDGITELGVPELLMTGGLDPGTGGDEVWALLPHPEDRRVHLPLGGHNVFTDFSGALDPAGAIDPAVGFRIVSTAALAFAEWIARGDPAAGAVLDGSRSFGDDAQVLLPGMEPDGAGG